MQSAYDEHPLLDLRREKDRFWKLDPHSPLDPADRPGFSGLKYFAPDAAFAVLATWAPATNPQRVSMATSTGEEKEYLDAGTLTFHLGNVERSLKGFQNEARPHELFVPFRDATSGKESYGAARYLEVELPLAFGSPVLVDFNYAYNPYCAYSEAYSCPLPPRENWLDVPIRAGEKAFKSE